MAENRQIDVIAFDADDTLWQNEVLYSRAQARLERLLEKYHPPEWIRSQLFETEMRNLEHFGYGIKAFMLSMVETAVELTEGRISGTEVKQILELGKEMLAAEVTLLDGVAETVAALAELYDLMIITKGDLLDQERKVARSGLAGYFPYVEVISDKTPEVYAGILERRSITPARFVMVGNSLRSDILPVAALGGIAVYIPHELTWAHEMVEPDGGLKFHELARIDQLPALIAALEDGGEAS